MRALYVIGGSIAILALAGVMAWTRFAPAQAPPPPPPTGPGELMTITVPEVEVRSGPSMNFYATSKLRAGQQVKVISRGEKNHAGWLAIEPPPHSYSWINANFVKRNPGSATGFVVTAEDSPVPIKPGSNVYNDEPTVESVKLPRGTQVVIVSGEKILGGASWLLIEPPVGDVRFLPESAVAKGGSVQPTTPTVPRTTTGYVVAPGGNQSTLGQANDALDKARELYRLAAQTSSDSYERNLATTRLNYLQSMPVSQASGGQQPGYPGSTGSSPTISVGTIAPGPSNAGSTALYSSAPQTSPAQWTKWGTLRRFNISSSNGQPFYRLEDERGGPLGYAIAAPGLTLEPYVGKFVILYGETAYRADDVVRGNYTIVSRLSIRDP